MLPLYLASVRLGDPGYVGFVLALSNGAGLLLLPFLVRVIDGPARLRAMRRAAGAMIGGCALVVLAAPLVPTTEGEAVTPVAATLVAVGVLTFGVARVLASVCLLTEVARLPGDATATQGWNGASQRSGSGLALLAAGGLIALAAWTGAFVALMVVLAGWMALVSVSVPPVAERMTDVAPARRAVVAPARACLAQLRRPRVLASVALNVIILLVLLTGNSFAAVAHGTEPSEASVAMLLTATIVVRDVCSVLAGIGYGLARRWVGETGMAAVIGTAAAASLLLLAAAPASATAHLVAAVVQGALVGFGIATTNLLATTDGDAGTPLGIRIAASQLPAGAVLVIAPIGLGVLVGGAGPEAAYAVLALLAAGAAGVMVSSLRIRSDRAL